MKIISLFFLMTVSTSVFADYFNCHLQYGPFNRASVEAEYRVVRASVEAGTFICTGEIVNRDIIVTITSNQTGESNSVTTLGSSASVELTALNQHGDGLDHGICKCGME